MAITGMAIDLATQKFGQDHTGFSHGAFSSNVPAQQSFGDRNFRKQNTVPYINTASKEYQNGSTEPTPGTAYNMNFTPLLPSELLLGSPFQPGSPGAFSSPQFRNISQFQPATNAFHQQTQQYQQNQQTQMGSPTQSVNNPMSPQMYQTMMSPANLQPSISYRLLWSGRRRVSRIPAHDADEYRVDVWHQPNCISWQCSS